MAFFIAVETGMALSEISRVLLLRLIFAPAQIGIFAT